MSWLDKTIQEKLDYFVEQSGEVYSEKNPQPSFDLMLKGWEVIPEPKEQWFESFNIVTYLIDMYISVYDIHYAQKWLDELRKIDAKHNDWPGIADYFEGKVKFEMGNYEEAKVFFDRAFKDSEGRCFRDEDDKKYKNFFTNPKRFINKSN